MVWQAGEGGKLGGDDTGINLSQEVTVTWAASAVMQLVSSSGHLCVCTAEITAYLQACCSRSHLSPQKLCRAELGKLSSPRVSLHNPLQAARRCRGQQSLCAPVSGAPVVGFTSQKMHHKAP